MRKEMNKVVPKDVSKDSGEPLFNSISESTRVPISLTQTIISNFKLFCQTFKLSN